MAEISDRVSRSLHEYIILPGWTTKKTTYQNVDLTTKLSDDVILRYPLIPAAMSCVSGYKMTLECAKNGIMAVVPCSLPIGEQAEIVRKVKEKEVKKGDIEFNDDPIKIKDLKKTIGDAVELYEEFGHSNIPLCDDFRKFMGIFRYQEGIPSGYLGMSLEDVLENAKKGSNYLGEIIKPFDPESAEHGIDYFWDSDMKEDMHKRMKEKRIKTVPVINKDGTLAKLAFIYNFHGYLVAAAIHTHKGWDKRTEELLKAGSDMMFTDSSDAKSDFQLEVISEFKKKYPGVPLCVGNIVDAEGYKRLVERGADVVKVGMGSGGSCITSENRGVGRGIATAIEDVAKEAEINEKKVPIIADGGIGARRISVITSGDYRLSEYVHDTASIAKALALGAKVVMMGTGFNMFEEAEGGKHIIGDNRYIERWGEGSRKAMTLARYGIEESVRRADVEEGIDDMVSSAGRLKPGTERIALNLRMTFSNVGAKNPEEFREKCILELLSPQAQKETGVG